MAIGAEEPILPKLDRLDNMLEEIRGRSRTSPKSSTASSPSSSMDFSSRSLEKLCRPLDRVVMETELKGTLLQRLEHVEDRLLKLCIQVEAERKREEEDHHSPERPHKNRLIKGLFKKVISPTKHHSNHKPA